MRHLGTALYSDAHALERDVNPIQENAVSTSSRPLSPFSPPPTPAPGHPLSTVDWEDTIALHDITSIPKISPGDFDIRTHVGVLILDEEASEDPSLTLVQKLTQGKIFEHPGTSLLRSGGRSRRKCM
jgi:hypothetical protein